MLNKAALLIILIISIYSCTTSVDNNLTEEYYPCVENPCNSIFEISKEVTPELYIDDNGFNHIQFWGPKYFTVKGILGKLKEKYEVNGIPLIETTFDSDYWIWLNNLTFTLPVYSPFSWFIDNEFQNPIPIGTITITLDEMIGKLPPMNISGYSINENTCMDCPYSSSIFGTYSKYNYKPQHSFYLGPEMRGDTLNIFIQVLFNSDLGPQEKKDHILRVIVDNQ